MEKWIVRKRPRVVSQSKHAWILDLPEVLQSQILRALPLPDQNSVGQSTLLLARILVSDGYRTTMKSAKLHVPYISLVNMSRLCRFFKNRLTQLELGSSNTTLCHPHILLSGIAAEVGSTLRELRVAGHAHQRLFACQCGADYGQMCNVLACLDHRKTPVFPKLETLDLVDWLQPGSQEMTVNVLDQMPNIKHLRLNHVRGDFLSVIMACPTIETLQVAGSWSSLLPLDAKWANPNGLRSIRLSIPNALYRSAFIESLVQVLKDCTQLRRLVLEDTYHWDGGLPGHVYRPLDALVFPHLEHLELRHLHLVEKTLFHLACGGSSLRSLVLVGCGGVDLGLLGRASNGQQRRLSNAGGELGLTSHPTSLNPLKHLDRLELVGLPPDSNKGLVLLLDNCRDLRHVALVDIELDKEAVNAMAKRMVQCETLEYRGTSSDEIAQTMSQAMAEAPQSHLRRLDLGLREYSPAWEQVIQQLGSRRVEVVRVKLKT